MDFTLSTGNRDALSPWFPWIKRALHCAALRDFDNTKELSKITIPTLVIVGDRDVPTPWTGSGEILAREITGAKSVCLPAAHLSNLEQPRLFTTYLLEFLLSDHRSSTERGVEVRRRCHG